MQGRAAEQTNGAGRRRRRWSRRALSPGGARRPLRKSSGGAGSCGRAPRARNATQAAEERSGGLTRCRCGRLCSAGEGDRAKSNSDLSSTRHEYCTASPPPAASTSDSRSIGPCVRIAPVRHPPSGPSQSDKDFAIVVDRACTGPRRWTPPTGSVNPPPGAVRHL
ncbi:hypothetical protein ACHAWF_016796 [Thalassiosira exigua]